MTAIYSCEGRLCVLRSLPLFLLCMGMALGAGCASAPSDSAEVQARLAAVATAGEEELSRLATADPEPKVRIAAVQRMTRQDQIEQVALKDANSGVRAKAAERLRDPAALERVILAQPQAITLELIQRAEPALLLKIIETHQNEGIRTIALGRIVDEQVLQQVAAHRGVQADTRVRAVTRIRDQAFLQQLALLPTTPADVAAAATRAVKDPALLPALTRAQQALVRRLATARVQDQALLINLATQDPDADVRMIAAGRIDDQRVLGELALTSPHAAVRRAASARVDDPQVLAALASKETESGAQEVILKRTSDPAVLAALLANTGAASVGCPALSRVHDLAVLQKVAARRSDSSVRQMVQLRLLLEHPPVKLRAPDLRLTCAFAATSQGYGPFAFGQPKFHARGERITMRLARGEKLLIERSWWTEFPGAVQLSGMPLDFPALIDLSSLAGAVLDAAGLDARDVNELTGAAYSYDIRLAAIERATYSASLEGLLAIDKDVAIRAGIQRRLRGLRGR